jgi:hypothetical protein
MRNEDLLLMMMTIMYALLFYFWIVVLVNTTYRLRTKRPNDRLILLFCLQDARMREEDTVREARTRFSIFSKAFHASKSLFLYETLFLSTKY